MVNKKSAISKKKKSTKSYRDLIDSISLLCASGRKKSFAAVNSILLETYWAIGKYIVEFEQGGSAKANYGDKLLPKLSADLTIRIGRGFSLSNLIRFRQFYLSFTIDATPSHKLSWSHYVELLKIENTLERRFYQQQAVLENWSIRELKRQKESSLFLRLASGKQKKEIIKLSQKGKLIEKPEDILKDTYIFEFLKIPEPYQINETNLEKRLINQLQEFLLELGKGFTFVGRQYRITLANRHHYIDLVFYHRILKCFVRIDLKKEEAGYEDVGQMNMYLG